LRKKFFQAEEIVKLEKGSQNDDLENQEKGKSGGELDDRENEKQQDEGCGGSLTKAAQAHFSKINRNNLLEIRIFDFFSKECLLKTKIFLRRESPVFSLESKRTLPLAFQLLLNEQQN
jgi:hypothetical protein